MVISSKQTLSEIKLDLPLIKQLSEPSYKDRKQMKAPVLSSGISKKVNCEDLFVPLTLHDFFINLANKQEKIWVFGLNDMLVIKTVHLFMEI